jgi:outer membrane lipoprotein SlyB
MGIKSVTSKVQNNVVGAVAGAGLAWWASRKYMGVSGIWKTSAAVLVGALVGAYAQSMVKAKSSAPKATDVKK